MKRVIEGVVTAMLIALIGAFFGLFLHVNELEAHQRGHEKMYKDIKSELMYIRKRIDNLHERN